MEPLRELFKDEVRLIGEELGLPKEMVWRHPFPGPGLAVRVVGEITPERLDLLRKADDIARREHGGLFIPLALSRQELADMTGTTVETAIRVMSRWAKQELVATRDDGFVLLDRGRLAEIAGLEGL